MKWEYLTIERDHGDLQWLLNLYGKDGWELISILQTNAGEIGLVFKRPVPEPSSYASESDRLVRQKVDSLNRTV